MTNCIKCGRPLKKGSKFCTKCGAKISLNEIQPEFESNNDNNTNDFVQSETSSLEPQPEILNNNSLKNKLLGFYIILVIPLYLMGQGTEEMIAFSIYSVVNIVVISLRINSPNTFNLIVKILLLLQFVFILSIVIPEANYLFVNLVSSIATVLFALLSLVILLMVFIGNRKKS